MWNYRSNHTNEKKLLKIESLFNKLNGTNKVKYKSTVQTT